MSLITVQKTLARIYTDSKLRDDFLANPDVVGRSLGLNCEEILQLSKLSSQEVNLFASSLKYKRLGEIRKLLPLSSKVLGKEFNSLFFKYSEAYLPTGNRKHLADAIAFLEFMSDLQSGWILDVLRYEKNRLKMLSVKSLFICDRFKYNMRSIIDNLQETNFTSKLQPQLTIVIWFRLSLRHRWRCLFLSFPNLPFIFTNKTLAARS